MKKAIEIKKEEFTDDIDSGMTNDEIMEKYKFENYYQLKQLLKEVNKLKKQGRPKKVKIKFI